MKKTKIIIPALGLLLLSTAASVSGTVAWFAANSSVTANAMSITATTDSEFLVISKTTTLTANAKSVNLAAPSGSVLPTNRVDNSGWKWVTATGTSTTDGTKDGSYTNLTIDEDTVANFGQAGDPAKKYYVYDSVYVGLAVGSSVPSGKDLKCNVSFTAAQASTLNKCLTVGLDAENNMTADFDERYLMNNDSSATVNGTSVLIAGSGLSTTAKEIKIYAFFNGDNEFCTTQNAQNLAGITINLTFNLVDHVVNP